jgi:hypothetical protein
MKPMGHMKRSGYSMMIFIIIMIIVMVVLVMKGIQGEFSMMLPVMIGMALIMIVSSLVLPKLMKKR